MAKKKSKKTETKVKVYVCGVDWQHEIGVVSDVKMYASVAKLKKERSCWEECGIVELEVTLSKWIVKQDLFKFADKLPSAPAKLSKKDAKEMAKLASKAAK